MQVHWAKSNKKKKKLAELLRHDTERARPTLGYDVVYIITLDG